MRRSKGRGTFIVMLALVVATAVFWSPVYRFIMTLIYPLEYEEIIIKYAREYDVDPYVVAALIKAESSFLPDAHSNKDAKGLMQLTDSTAKWAAGELGLPYSFESLVRPELNIQIGVWYLRHLIDVYDGDLELALCAYNAGRGNVDKWLKNEAYASNGKLHTIPFPETEKYLKNVLAHIGQYKALYPALEE